MALVDAGGTPLQSDPYELTIIGGNPVMEAITKNQFVLREFVRKTSTDLLKKLEDAEQLRNLYAKDAEEFRASLVIKLEEMEDRQTEILEKLNGLCEFIAGIPEPVEK